MLSALPEDLSPDLCRRLRIVKAANEHRRLVAIAMLVKGHSVSAIARLLGAARSSVNRWRQRFLTDGLDGLRNGTTGRRRRLCRDKLATFLLALVDTSPRDWNYQRSRWSSELMAKVIHDHARDFIHPSTIRRLLREFGIVYRRACPTLCIKAPDKEQKLADIAEALKQASTTHPVLFVDEADIDLNPRIGADWMRRSAQKRVPTPGQNRKHYVAGALCATTGKVTVRYGDSKCSGLFIDLLKALKRRYREAERITLVLDNYIIHKSRETFAWLARHPQFVCLFQPAYHPWVNRIERLWKAMHDTVTRNHQHRSLDSLLVAVKRFLRTASPFPGNRHAMAKV
ncbi:MAG: IS630 family transposase [Gammaproteobacteria bacterium]|nr:IS630 family transposase [Gammaproteobacteria bacterium]